MAEYTQPGRLHMAYSFELLSNDSSPAHIRTTVETLRQRAPQSWPCWTISNHDVERVVSRWGRQRLSAAHGHAAVAPALPALRGSVCVFQGEELGLAEADVPFEALRDPYGIAFWPTFKGRDGCRTPMPWDASRTRGVLERGSRGCRSRRSICSCRSPHRNATCRRRCTASAGCSQWRKTLPLLITGDIEFLAATDSVLAFRRFDSRRVMLVAFNLSGEPASVALPGITVGELIGGHGLPEGSFANATLHLPGHGVAFFALAAP